MRAQGHRIYPLVIFLLVVLGGGYLTTSIYSPGEWYAESVKPDWHPPAGFIALSLFLCSLLSALAAWLIWRRRSLPAAGPGLFMWILQLVFTAGWWWMFFGLYRPGWALGAVLLLWLTAAMTIALFHGTRRLAAWLMLPWLAWITVASAVNYEFWRLNGGGF